MHKYVGMTTQDAPREGLSLFYKVTEALGRIFQPTMTPSLPAKGSLVCLVSPLVGHPVRTMTVTLPKEGHPGFLPC